MPWKLVAEEKEFPTDPPFLYMSVKVYYSDDDIPTDCRMYKENGTLRLPHNGWSELKSALKEYEDIEIEE
jgi:hypothetical protein